MLGSLPTNPPQHRQADLRINELDFAIGSIWRTARRTQLSMYPRRGAVDAITRPSVTFSLSERSSESAPNGWVDFVRNRRLLTTTGHEIPCVKGRNLSLASQ